MPDTRTDKPAMFVLHKSALPLSEACLHSLMASLNAPVADIEELPAGPVRAAIVIFAEEYGGLGLAVGIRALEGGDTVLYKTREPIPDEAGIPEALEGALGFAEGFGFLFDDDMIGSGAGRCEALEHWNRLMGGGEVFAPGAPAEPPTPASNPGLPGADQALLPPIEDLLDEDGPLSLSDVVVQADSGTGSPLPDAEVADELLLDELMGEVDEESELLLERTEKMKRADVAVAAGAEEDAASTQRVDEAISLTKFRDAPKAEKAEKVENADEPAERATPPAGTPATMAQERVPQVTDDPQDVGAGGVAALGKIAIVKQRGEAARSIFARLLSSF